MMYTHENPHPKLKSIIENRLKVDGYLNDIGEIKIKFSNPNEIISICADIADEMSLFDSYEGLEASVALNWLMANAKFEGLTMTLKANN